MHQQRSLGHELHHILVLQRVRDTHPLRLVFGTVAAPQTGSRMHTRRHIANHTLYLVPHTSAYLNLSLKSR